MSTATVYPNGQTETPYWLPRTGVDAVSFIKQASPPLAWLNRGILYELVDGFLYFNGQKLQTGDVINPDGVTFVEQASNPGDADTLWMSSASTPAGHLFHGDHDMENYDPATVYVGSNVPNGLLADGATGAINNPLSSLVEALTLWNSTTGTCFKLVGQLTDPIVVPPQTAFVGSCGLSFMSVVGDIELSGADWTNPPPFGSNQCSLANLVLIGGVDFQDTGMDTPLLSINNCVVQNFVQTNGDGTGSLLIKDSVISGDILVVNTQADIEGCQFGLLGMSPGDVTIFHSDAFNMHVTIGNVVIQGGSPSVLSIEADSVANVLTVSLVGDCAFSEIDVLSVASPGGLVLLVDDIIPPIIWGPGAEANTTLQYIKQATEVGYAPAVPGDWLVPPVQVAEALDMLAATGTGDVVGPAGATDNAIVRFDGVTGKLIQNSVVTITDLGNINGGDTVQANTLTPSVGPSLVLSAGAGSVVVQPNAANALEITTGQGIYATDLKGPAAALTALVNGVNPLITSNDLTAHTGASSNVHGVGLGNDVVGTGTIQALTNKTISSGSNTITISAAANANINALIDQDVRTSATPIWSSVTVQGSLYVGSPEALTRNPINSTANAGTSTIASHITFPGFAMTALVHLTSKLSSIPGWAEYMYSATCYNVAGVLTIVPGVFSLAVENGLGFTNTISFAQSGANLVVQYTTAVVGVQSVLGWVEWTTA